MGLRAQLLLGPVPLDEPPEDVLHDLQETGQEQIRRLLTPKGEFFLGYNEPVARTSLPSWRLGAKPADARGASSARQAR